MQKLKKEDEAEIKALLNTAKKIDEPWTVVCPMLRRGCVGPRCPQYVRRKITADGTMSGVCSLSLVDKTEMRIFYDANLDAYTFKKQKVEKAKSVDEATKALK